MEFGFIVFAWRIVEVVNQWVLALVAGHQNFIGSLPMGRYAYDVIRSGAQDFWPELADSVPGTDL
ncbi:UNVERIFIED_CONTAM: hypothetical protein ACS92_04365 [Bacillus cereus]